MNNTSDMQPQYRARLTLANAIDAVVAATPPKEKSRCSRVIKQSSSSLHSWLAGRYETVGCAPAVCQPVSYVIAAYCVWSDTTALRSSLQAVLSIFTTAGMPSTFRAAPQIGRSCFSLQLQRKRAPTSLTRLLHHFRSILDEWNTLRYRQLYQKPFNHVLHWKCGIHLTCNWGHDYLNITVTVRCRSTLIKFLQ